MADARLQVIFKATILNIIFLTSTAKMPDLYIWTNSGIKAGRNDFRSRQNISLPPVSTAVTKYFSYNPIW